MPPSSIGPYRVIRPIGEGGMGTVFEARHETIERRVAIKVLNPDYARKPDAAMRFFNEARAVNRIQHPGLVQVWDHGQLEDGTAYIVMEFLEGETLAARLKRHDGKLPLTEVVRLSRQIASALRSAHDKGVVHRDLKPDNVMIISDPGAGGGERAKILDFGIAKFTQSEETSRVKTRTDQLIGTPTYMSPEQCRGATAIDDKTDGYALGVMLFEMLAGKPPFDAEGVGELIAMHIYEAPPKLSQLAPSTPPPLMALVETLLRKDKEQRPAMSEVEETLAEIDDELQLESLSQRTRVGRTRSTGSDHEPARRGARWPILAAGLLVSAGAFGAAWWMFGAKPRTPMEAGKTAPPPPPATPTAPATSAVPPNKAADPQPTPPEPRGLQVVWSFVTEPPSATVTTSDGKRLGTTPFELRQASAKGQESVRIALPGYEEQSLRIEREKDVAIRRKLRPIGPNANRPRRPAQPAVDADKTSKDGDRYEIED